MIGHKRAFSVLASMFFMWGFITVNNDVLVNSFKGIFSLSPVERSLVQQSFFGAFFLVALAYFLYSSVTGRDPINQFGYKKGMITGLLICGTACMLFLPAAYMESYLAFLAALFILAAGVAVLQLCANPFATILGEPSDAGSRLNLAQGLNSLGTTLGPVVGFLLIYQVFSEGTPTALSVAKTYGIYGMLFFAMAMIANRSEMPSFANKSVVSRGWEVLKMPGPLLGAIAIFFYVGSEVTVGTWLVDLLKSQQFGGLDESRAGMLLSWFWGGLMTGRLVGATMYADRKLSSKVLPVLLYSVGVPMLLYLITSIEKTSAGMTMNWAPVADYLPYLAMVGLMVLAFIAAKGREALSLVLFSGLNVLFFMLIATGTHVDVMWLAVGSGLFFSVGWSNIFSLAIKGLGPLTSKASALLVMAIAGGAILPALQAELIATRGIGFSFWLPAAGLVPVMLFGLWAAVRPVTRNSQV